MKIVEKKERYYRRFTLFCKIIRYYDFKAEEKKNMSPSALFRTMSLNDDNEKDWFYIFLNRKEYENLKAIKVIIDRNQFKNNNDGEFEFKLSKFGISLRKRFREKDLFSRVIKQFDDGRGVILRKIENETENKVSDNGQKSPDVSRNEIAEEIIRLL